MSKNTNNQNSKSLKTHKRNNSNSYNMNTMANITNQNPLFNQTDVMLNSTNNISNHTLNPNLLNNLNLSKQMTVGEQGNNNFPQNTNVPHSSHPINSSNVESRQEDVKSIQQRVDCVGKIPSPRFGHTIVLVNPVKVVLFGGAVGDTKNFVFSNDTYVLNLMTKIWLKLESYYIFLII